jgi:L-arabinokinase
VVAVFYISGHGFGHASRQIEVLQALLAERPDTRILVRTAADTRLFETLRVNSRGAVSIEAAETDTGIAQIDSLRIDEDESARAAARFYAGFDARAAAEADRLRSANAAIVVGDIPPLAFAAAAPAGIPSVAVANFTWDWIYGVYGAFDRMAPLAVPTIRRAYALATTALRLPLHGGFAPMAAVTHDIPFIARQSTRDRAETRDLLGITDDRPVVLPSFGAYGAALPVDRLRASRRFTLLTIDDPLQHGLRYPDLVAAADVVVSKPGYGIVSECVANGTALLYTSRGRFIEYDLLVTGMPRVLRCRYLSQEDLLAGHWEDAVDALVAQPAPPERPAINGARVAAREILRMASC